MKRKKKKKRITAAFNFTERIRLFCQQNLFSRTPEIRIKKTLDIHRGLLRQEEALGIVKSIFHNIVFNQGWLVSAAMGS